MEEMLLTGGTGFLGRAMMPALSRWSRVTTLGRSDGADIRADLSREVPELARRYDIVVHAAALAHSDKAADPGAWIRTNATGTSNLCRALELAGLPRALVYVSTVAVYGLSSGRDIDETKPLRADTPYAASKIEAERMLGQWADDTGVKLTILRPALIVGPDAPGNLGMMERNIRRGTYMSVGGGMACRSMVAAPDVADAIELAWKRGGVYNLCHPEAVRLSDLGASLARAYGARRPLSFPVWLAKAIGRIGDLSSLVPVDSARVDKLMSTLTFSSDRAMTELGWRPRPVLEWIDGGFR